MEKTISAVGIQCDTCEKLFSDHNQVSLFPDGDEAMESLSLSEWWMDGLGRHYCPKHVRAAKKEGLDAPVTGISELDRIIALNAQIAGIKQNRGHISDGYHSFDQLYAHRSTLWVSLCNLIAPSQMTDDCFVRLFKTRRHVDGESAGAGWFVLGMAIWSYDLSAGHRIDTCEGIASYHLTDWFWDRLDPLIAEIDQVPNERIYSPDEVMAALQAAFFENL